MERIVTRAGMRAFEKFAMRREGIDALALMERAAEHVAAAVADETPDGEPILLLCGTGNNGGDGLAALRLLCAAGYDAAALVIGDEERLSPAAAEQLRRARENGVRVRVQQEAPEPRELMDAGCLVDALFGTGLSRPVKGVYAETIEAVIASGVRVLAVDLPSGVDADSGRVLGSAVRADKTITFQYRKRGQRLYPGQELCGELIVRSISSYGHGNGDDVFEMTDSDFAELLPPRAKDSHKGKNGRALLIGGSDRYAGAALMSACAALRAGAGVLTACVPGGIREAFFALPEAVCAAAGEGTGWDDAALAAAAAQLLGKTAAALGSGMGELANDSLLVAALESKLPLAIDADGLNHMAKNPALLGSLHDKVVLTPHPAEFARLTAQAVEDVTADPIAQAVAAAKNWGCVVLLKGAVSVIASPARTALNCTGNAGLAKGGSGDVLTGLILALLAQGLEPFDAACAGAYLLGVSADAAIKLLGNRMLMSRDIVGAVADTLARPFSGC